MQKESCNIALLDDPSSDKTIVYLPLDDYAVLADKAEVPKILADLSQKRIDKPQRKIYWKPKDVEGLRSLMILPNNKCNFHCSYCYSANGRTNEEIDPAVLEAGLRYFLHPDRAKGERLSVSVLGGGEPLLSWNILRPALEKAMPMLEQRQTPCPISLVTNGSVCTDEIIQFCLRHQISLSVSFDILEDVQNAQRGAWDIVSANINRFTQAGLDVALNTVISNNNVERMSEMIEHLAKYNPGVKKVSFKTMISKRHFSDREERRKYYREFIRNFFQAKTLADEYGIYLTCSYMNACLCVTDRYCQGKFVITSEGDISICHTVGSKRDELYDKFIYGHIDHQTGEVSIDKDKLQAILSYDVSQRDECAECPARWHCAGGCYADHFHLSGEDRQLYCESMRAFLAAFLKYRYKL